MKIVFAGTPQFAVPALEALVAAGHEVLAVYTQPDRPAGRGRKLTASPVKQTALRLGIPVEQPQTLRDEVAVQTLARYSPDAMVVVAYGLLLPLAVLNVPRLGCINIHASLLPRWRGAAPIQRALLAGDARTGISIMRMEEGLDTGPVYLEKTADIGPQDTGGVLHDRLAQLGATAIVQALSDIAAGRAQARAQQESGATYARKLEKREALIDWSRPAIEIERKVRAFHPWPVAETRWQDKQLRVWSAQSGAAEAHSAECTPGKVLAATNEGIRVACGEGVLTIRSLQLPGGKPLAAVDFLNSHGLRDVRFG